MRHPTNKKERRVIRITRRQRTPDFVRKAGPFAHRPDRMDEQDEIAEALEEWAEDYEGYHSVFED